jgi:HD-GYP domain-containing protein (c-di-GMP phosphodiesterase class II)
VVLVAQDAIVFERAGSAATASDVIRQRAGHAYDPELAGAFCREAAGLLDDAANGSAWDRVLACEPPPQRTLGPRELDVAFEALADYVDLKSPWTAGHSRAVARLAADAGEAAGLPTGDCRTLRQAALLHDLGRCGVPNSIWDKAAALTEAEWERVRLHPYLTERLLLRIPALAPLADVACGHHERADGSGYHRRLRGADLPVAGQLLAAADAYQAMTQDRPHRPAPTAAQAAAELRDQVRSGRHNGAAVEAVLGAAGHAHRRRGLWPNGLTSREVEVLRLVAHGLPNRETARRLSISERTVAHHIQHAYDKIGVSTRGAVVLYALQHDLLEP